MKSFDEINIIPFIIVILFLIYKLYVERNDAARGPEGYATAAKAPFEKNNLLKSSFEGMVRGFTMGVMTGGLESGLAYGTLLSVLNPFMDSFNTTLYSRQKQENLPRI